MIVGNCALAISCKMKTAEKLAHFLGSRPGASGTWGGWSMRCEDFDDFRLESGVFRL